MSDRHEAMREMDLEGDREGRYGTGDSADLDKVIEETKALIRERFEAKRRSKKLTEMLDAQA